MQNLSLFDWSICLGYLLLVFALGLWFAGKQQTNDDYFVGGRNVHWLPIGLSLFAGLFSSLSFVGLPAEAAYKDYHLYLAILFIPLVVVPIVWVWFIPLYFRLGATSCHEYIQQRFNRPLRLLASILFMLYTIGWMGNMLRAIGVILQAVLETSQMQTALLLVGVGLFATFYTTIGGVKAVVWTDALQAFAMGGGMLLVLVLTISKIDGGVIRVYELGATHNRFDMMHTEFGFQSANIWGVVAFGFFVYLSGQAVTFTAVQRYVSMPTVAAARKSLVVNGVMTGIVGLIFFLCGSAIFAFYHQQEPTTAQVQTDPQSQNLYDQLKQSSSQANRQDQILPRFIMAELPYDGLIGLMLAGLFAAAMSSVDSGINSMTASVVCDWQQDRPYSLRQSRVLCGVFGLVTVGLALVFFFAGGQVFPLMMRIAGMFLGLLLGLFLLGLLVDRANSWSATIGTVAGGLGIVAAIATGVSHWWYGAFGCLPVLLFGSLVSLRNPRGKKI